jgi:hypothetical protein
MNIQIYYQESQPAAHRRTAPTHREGVHPGIHHSTNRGSGTVNPIVQTTISNTTAPDRILHYPCPRLLLASAAVLTRRRLLPTVCPNQLAMFSQTERKHKSINSRNLTYEESFGERTRPPFTGILQPTISRSPYKEWRKG